MSLSAVAARDKYVKLPLLREDRPLCGCRDRFGPSGMAARQDLAPETAGGGRLCFTRRFVIFIA